jgi:hypothetical protein
VTNNYLLLTMQFVGSNTVQYVYHTVHLTLLSEMKICTKYESETIVMLKYIEPTRQWKNCKLVNKGSLVKFQFATAALLRI